MLLTRSERDSLDLTLAVRNESQHAYEHLEARQVHATVLAQRRTAPALIARLGRWVGRVAPNASVTLVTDWSSGSSHWL